MPAGGFKGNVLRHTQAPYGRGTRRQIRLTVASGLMMLDSCLARDDNGQKAGSAYDRGAFARNEVLKPGDKERRYR
jgi:hypothetical protein